MVRMATSNLPTPTTDTTAQETELIAVIEDGDAGCCGGSNCCGGAAE